MLNLSLYTHSCGNFSNPPNKNGKICVRRWMIVSPRNFCFEILDDNSGNAEESERSTHSADVESSSNGM